MVTKTFLPSNLYDSSDNRDSSDSFDSSDSSESGDSSDSSAPKKSPTNFFHIQKKNFFHNKMFTKKLKNSNCDKTQKLKLWINSKTQIVINLKNSNCNET